MLTAGIILLGIGAAVLEGIGLSFILPIVELQQSSTTGPAQAGGLHAAFLAAFEAVGVPFTLKYVILGVAVVITARFSAAFVVAWLYRLLRADYVRHLQIRAFESAVDAETGYFDRHGSEEILNTIVTEIRYSGRVITWFARIFQEAALALMYLAITLYIAPYLTLFAALVLGSITYLVRFVIEPGWAVGERVAAANEELQTVVQEGIQGIRDVKLFGMQSEILGEFYRVVDDLKKAMVDVGRNKAFIAQFYQLVTALTMFALIYLALTYASLTLATLGLFLFAMFRLAPRVSTLNNVIYKAESDLPHLVRTQRFIGRLDGSREEDDGRLSAPSTVERIQFNSVSFSYNDGEAVLNDIDFTVERGEFVAFAGSSGAGKSTIISLLARMYEPDRGAILANDIPLEEIELRSWRDRLAIVRQSPYVFNDTLRFNLTVGNRDVSRERLEEACRISRVDEFLEELPAGLDTMLGEDGVRLSGGQRQRVAIARALLKDADIVAFDEATSDLDASLEKEVHDAFQALDRDIIVLVVAHRLSTITSAERIYTIDGGRIAEVGDHDELLENGGHYAELYAIQSSV